jgi:flagellar motility protein MotE (MotC chaperone)
MKLLSNPVVCVVLGLLLGIGAGLGVFWREAVRLAVIVHAQSVAAEEPERPEKPWDFWTLEIENLASELKDQKAALAVRESTVAAREERLAADLVELAKTRKQIETLRSEVESGMVEFEATETKNLKTLAKTYSELTPKAAVGIMAKMETTTVVKILYLMKSDVVSPILQEMGTSPDPDMAKRAAEITDRLRLVKALKTSAT